MAGSDSLSVGVAFAAGFVSFLSPCVLPLVPSYVAFVSGRTLDDLSAPGEGAARRRAAVHGTFFVLGFSAVFIALGATATAIGAGLRRVLPLVQQAGGLVIAAFGLSLLGVLRVPALMRERRAHIARKPAGLAGSIVAGAAFGAGWTPCVGPVLASILLYSGMEGTMQRGMQLLTAYSVGLGIPFVLSALGLDWFLARGHGLRRWARPAEKLAGVFLLLLGVLLFTGHFTMLSGYLAGFGQLINLNS